MRDPLRIPGSISNGRRTAVQRPKQGNSVQLQPAQNRLEVEHSGFRREGGYLVLGKPHATTVVPDELSPSRQALIPGAYLGYLPLELEMGERGSDVHQRRPIPQRPEGDADAVAGLGVLDARLSHRHLLAPRTAAVVRQHPSA